MDELQDGAGWLSKSGRRLPRQQSFDHFLTWETAIGDSSKATLLMKSHWPISCVGIDPRVRIHACEEALPELKKIVIKNLC